MDWDHLDRSDPEARALARLEQRKWRDRKRRTGGAAALAALAVGGPIAATPLTGAPGATVGAIVIGGLCVALAAAIWPHRWSAEEHQHHELDSIWRELRGDSDRPVAWERCSAWAQARGDEVDLIMVTRAPAGTAAPSPYTRRTVRQLHADDVAAAAEAMEHLRAEAREQELGAGARHLEAGEVGRERERE